MTALLAPHPPEWHAARRMGIGGSDAAAIVSGDWLRLWREKTGRAEPEDLSGNFAVQLGTVTEALNLAWYERVMIRTVSRQGEQCVAADHPFLRCTLDGWDAVDCCVIQAKHVNGFAKIDEVVSRYTAQVSHEMIVTGAPKAILSVIVGTNAPVYERVDLDEWWASDYIGLCRDFWRHVENDEEPVQGAPLAPPPKIEKFRTVSFEGNSNWAAYAADWIDNRDSAKAFEKAAKEIKCAVEADVGLATGHGIKVARNKAGALSISIKKV